MNAIWHTWEELLGSTLASTAGVVKCARDATFEQPRVLLNFLLAPRKIGHLPLAFTGSVSPNLRIRKKRCPGAAWDTERRLTFCRSVVTWSCLSFQLEFEAWLPTRRYRMVGGGGLTLHLLRRRKRRTY
ncbi:unnamed protein product [Prorocentrum cordatum]|nr:unnamed protein product [Polarella glacialis]